MEPIVKRIYSLTVEGYDEGILKIQKFTKEFKQLDETKRKLNETLKTATSNNDVAGVAKLTAELSKLQTQQDQLQQSIKTTEKELSLLNGTYDEFLKKAKNPVSLPTTTPTATTQPGIPEVPAATEVNQYAKSLADVAEQQVRNRIATDANRLAQNALLKEISTAGSATEDQIRLLTQLRSEQGQLKVSTQELGVQERNIVKDLQSQDGAITKLSAQLNLLRTGYERLSEADRNGEEGKTQLTQIQKLDTALKALDAQQGKFGRSVGDYKQAYSGLNVAIQQILRETPSAAVSLNTFFLAISNNLPQLFDELQKAQAATKAANLASKEAAAVAKTEAINRAVAAGATIEQATAEGLLAEKTALANAAQTKSPSLLKQIGSSLLSVNTLLTLGVLGLTLYGSKFVDFVSDLFKTKSAVSELNDTYGELNKVIAEANKGAGQQLVNAKALLQSATDLNIPIAKRLEYAKELKKEFPQLLANIDAEAIANGKAKVSYEELSKSILDNAKARAAQNRIGDYASQLLTVEDNINKINAITKVQAAAARDRTVTISGSGTGTGGTTYTETAADQRAEIEERRKNAVSLQEIEKKRLEDRIAFFTRFAGGEEAIAKSIVDSHQKQQKEAKDHADKLSATDQNAFKEIDLIRNKRLEDAKAEILKLRLNNQSSFEAEQQYLLKVKDINTDALTAKQDYLHKKQKLNREEALTDAELGNEKLDIALKTQDQVVALRTKEADRLKEVSDAEANDLQNSLQERRDKVTDDPRSTRVQQLEAQQEYLAGIRVVQALHFEELRTIEKKYNQENIKEEEQRADATLKLEKEINKAGLEVTKARYEEQLQLIQDKGNIELQLIRRETAQKAIAILNSGKSAAKIAKDLAELEREQSIKTLDAEILDLQRQQLQKAKIYETDAQARRDFESLQTEIQVKEAAKRKLELEKEQSAFSSFLSKIKGFLKGKDVFKNPELDAAVKAAAASVRQTISDAYQSYFDRQRQKIDDEKEAAKERLDIEQNQALATAQSESEKDSIKRQFAAKQKEADKQASEEQRSLALKKLKIDYALATIKTFAQFGFPFGLIPAAALAIAYAFQRSEIAQQKFAKGGKALPEAGNGLITLAQNIPVQPNGDRINATLKPGEVVLNEEQQLRAGGPSFFKALGVPGFATGGYVSGLTVPGAFLRAPVISPGAFSNGSSAEVMAAMRQVSETVDKVAETVDTLAKQTNDRIDKIQVINNANDTVKTANKYTVANKVGVI